MSARLRAICRDYFKVAPQYFTLPDGFCQRLEAAFLRIGEPEMTRIIYASPTNLRSPDTYSHDEFTDHWASLGRRMKRFAEERDDQIMAALIQLFQIWRGGDDSEEGPEDLADIRGRDHIRWCARWASNFMPAVRLTSHQTASFALSDMDQDHVAELRAPWPAFMVKLEPGSLPMADEDGVSYVDSIQVMQSSSLSEVAPPFCGQDGHWSVFVATTDHKQLFCGDLGPHAMYAYGSVSADSDNAQNWSDLTSRSLRAACRIALNVVAHLNNSPLKKVTGRKDRTGKVRRIFRTPLDTTEFVVGDPVVVDSAIIESFGDYLTGRTGRAYKVSWVTRGHYRRQAHGPGHSLRRRQWIAPRINRRGKGPANVRDHIIKDQEETKDEE